MIDVVVRVFRVLECVFPVADDKVMRGVCEEFYLRVLLVSMC